MQQWEYLVKKRCSDYELTQFGNQGWELVSVDGASGGGTCFYFKRPKNTTNDLTNQTTSLQSNKTTPEKEWSMQDLFPGIKITQ